MAQFKTRPWQVRVKGSVATPGTYADLATEETWDYIMNKARVMELLHFFFGLQQNPYTRHFVVNKFKENFDVVCPPLLRERHMLIVLLAVRPPEGDLLAHLLGRGKFSMFRSTASAEPWNDN